jgi:hypothetical protein
MTKHCAAAAAGAAEEGDFAMVGNVGGSQVGTEHPRGGKEWRGTVGRQRLAGDLQRGRGLPATGG